MTTSQVPFPRSYWIIPSKILVGCYPDAKDPKEATVRELVEPCGQQIRALD